MSQFKVGDEVLFGRAHGEKTRGRIVEVNRSTYKIEQLEQRGTQRVRSAGTVWTVAHGLVWPAAGGAQPATPAVASPAIPPVPSSYRIGNRVEFRAKGRMVRGTVERINAKTLGVREDAPWGLLWRVPPAIVRIAGPATGVPSQVPEWPKGAKRSARSDDEIMRDIRQAYSALSPENLHCDGEISRSEAARRGRAIRANLRSYFTELGREVSEDEAFASSGLFD